MKTFKAIRKRLFKQMAFSIFVLTVLPMTVRTAQKTSNSAEIIETIGDRGITGVPQPGQAFPEALPTSNE